jgi:hypothetical protein
VAVPVVVSVLDTKTKEELTLTQEEADMVDEGYRALSI